MSGPYDRSDASPEAPCIQRRQWRLAATFDAVETRLMDALGAGYTDGDRRWVYTTLAGLFECTVDLSYAGASSTLEYRCHPTRRARLLSGVLLATLVGIGGLAAVATLDIVPIVGVPAGLVSMFELRTPRAVYGLGGLYVLTFAAIAFLNRGPAPAFSTDRLVRKEFTLSWPYFGYAGLLVLFVGTVFGAWLNHPAVVGAIFVFLFLVSAYANGRLPRLSGGPDSAVLAAGTPILDRSHPHLTVIVFAVLPSVLTFLGVFLSQQVFPPVPANLGRPAALVTSMVVFPAVLGVGYCLWCRRLLKRLPERTQPYRAWAPRLAVLAGFLLINLLVVLVTTAFVRMLLSPFFDHSVPDLGYGPVGIVTVVSAGVGLFSVALAGAGLQYRLTAITATAARVCTRGVRYGTYLVLFCLFGLLNVAVTNVLAAVVSGDGAFFDPSPQTIRAGVESELIVATVAAPVPIPEHLVVVSVYAVVLCPVVVIGLSWAVQMNHELRQRVAFALDSEPLEVGVDQGGGDGGGTAGEFPAPASIPVALADFDGVSMVHTGVFAPTKILISREFRAAVESDEQLRAVVAHEAYHVRNRDHLVALASTLVSAFLGGQNVLLAFYDLPESERAADRYAAEHGFGTALEGALDVCTRMETSGATDIAATTPQFLGQVRSAIETSRSTDVEGADALSRVRRAHRRVRSEITRTALAPAVLLFGGAVVAAAHPSPSERTLLLNLEERIQQTIRTDIDVKTTVLPEERTIVYPPRRTTIYETLRAQGLTDEAIDVGVSNLIEAGVIREVWDDHLVYAGDWQ